MGKVNLDILAQKLADGKISKEEFIYLHSLLQKAGKPNSPAAQQSANRPATGHPRYATQPLQHTAHQYTHEYIPASAVAQSSTPHSKVSHIKHYYKHMVALIGAVGILGTFITDFVIKQQGTPSAKVVSVKNLPPEQVRMAIQDLKLIADLLMQGNKWDEELLKDFTNQWNKLRDEDMQEVKISPWFHRLSAAVSLQAIKQRELAELGNVSAAYKERALLGLINELGITASKDKATQSGGAESYFNTAREDRPSRSPADTSRESGTPSSTAIATTKTPRQTPAVKTPDITRISPQSIIDTLNQFSVSYESGNLEEIVPLFSRENYIAGAAVLNQLMRGFHETFADTNNRRISFSGLTWEHDKDRARGAGQLQIKQSRSGVLESEWYKADIRIAMRNVGDKVEITNFQIYNKQIVREEVTKPAAAPVVAKVEKTPDIQPKPDPRFPTQAELQDIIIRYVDTYESGNVDGIMALFAAATWTQSETGIKEMQQEFANLFKTTSDRQMLINAVDWKIKGNKAMGTGTLVLTHYPKDKSQKTVTRKGKIRLVVEKNDHVPKITNIYHITD